MRRSGWTMMTALLCLAVAALWMRAEAKGAGAGQAQTQPKSSGGTAHKATASPYDRGLLRPALLAAKAPPTFDVKFTTTKGDFTIKVTREWAPLGADRLYNLVRHHFYDNASFFRVLKGFVVQWGISAFPAVTAAWEHAPIKDDPVVKSNMRGFVTYAMGGPNTRTTQLFINLVNNTRLDSMGFAPIGEVTEGMDVVDSLYSGYGEGAPSGNGPNQDDINKLGKPYLDKGFPSLDSVKTTQLILPEGATPAQKPAAPSQK